MYQDDDHDSNDDVFGESDLILSQVRGLRGRGKKKRGGRNAYLKHNPFFLVINTFKEVRSLSQKSLDRDAGRLEQPM
ncbi:MAG: hypothetical protein EZS28_019627 [Streblomastix strix]|uniref:Uncharacterized protein n=1 Tax=Streblomastix strix TaxID=222440 RepID=A0A5J4VRG4_9EUKA|nr:MAG: hypothetical protein EZS28_019627 [Streblomastix strix]